MSGSRLLSDAVGGNKVGKIWTGMTKLHINMQVKFWFIRSQYNRLLQNCLLHNHVIAHDEINDAICTICMIS